MTYKDVYDKLSIALIDAANDSIARYAEYIKTKLNLKLKNLLDIILMVNNNEVYGLYKHDTLFNYFKPTLEHFAESVNTHNLYILKTNGLKITSFLILTEHDEIYSTKKEFLKEIDENIEYYSEHLEKCKRTLEELFSKDSFTKRKKTYHNLARYEYKIEKLRKLKEEIEKED